MNPTSPQPRPAYEAHARERWVGEPPKRPGRTPFERDRARVLHSAALRRLAAKTQVVGPETDDFVRNRLTHTLEVAQVARDLAHALGCDPDVVETAALAHDLGHPPYGHNGERALDEAAAGCGGFEGNAQTLRILTRLEAKTADGQGSSVGLNLTRASLDAATKYPWPRARALEPHGTHADGTPRRVRKFGVYDDDAAVFGWVREGDGSPAAPGSTSTQRCLEAQVMDYADDVAYSVHDLEDGIVAGKIDLARLRDPARRREVWETVRDWYLPDAGDEEMDHTLGRLQAMASWPRTAYDARRPAQAALKNLTSDLIGRFCTAAVTATHAAYDDRALARYDADLVTPRETALEIGALKGVAAHYVMRARERQELLVRQRTVLTELVAALHAGGAALLEPAFAADLDAAGDDRARLRVVVDQVASLTDASAGQWHARLV